MNSKLSKLLMNALFGTIVIWSACGQTTNSNRKEQQEINTEQYRPQYHFTPKKGWMNDPNGMVYLNGKYHLFFQHNPDSTVWGPMHWGHAISTDLVHWQEQPIALFPDSLGTIFSGSAVVDKDNTAGFGKNAMVAIFTHHNHELEEAKTGKHQYQSLAYSTDEGKTWEKYKGNPVLPNPGIWDFRDPKVMWHNESKQWVMTLATKQTVTFYGSPNLKQWTKLSEFGEGIGAHGGVWECPDLFSLPTAEGNKWVLLVSINPGGPNGGSATQYFTGQFDGQKFIPDHQETKWIDYGPDDYAGVTWSNTGDRKVFLGWMSNWEYANVVPTQTWRSANTVPRELSLTKEGDAYRLCSIPVRELEKIEKKTEKFNDIKVEGVYELSKYVESLNQSYSVELDAELSGDLSIHFANSSDEKVIFGYEEATNTYYLDRTKSGKTSFEKNFARKATAPRLRNGKKMQLKVLIDEASIEIFADGGLSVMTMIFFPSSPFDKLSIKTNHPTILTNLALAKVGGN